MQFQTKVNAIKIVADVIVGAGASVIVKTIVKNNVAPEKRTAQVCVAVAAIVLGWMAADAAGTYTERQIDVVAELWTKLQKQLHPTN